MSKEAIKHTVRIGNEKFSVPLDSRGVFIQDGETIVNGSAMSKAELKIALDILQRCLLTKEELVFARRACNLKRELAYSLYPGDFGIEHLEENKQQIDSPDYTADKALYVRFLMDECIRQLNAIELTWDVESGL